MGELLKGIDWNKKITRREFLKLMAVSLAGLLTGCRKSMPVPKEVEIAEQEYENRTFEFSYNGTIEYEYGLPRKVKEILIDDLKTSYNGSFSLNISETDKVEECRQSKLVNEVSKNDIQLTNIPDGNKIGMQLDKTDNIDLINKIYPYARVMRSDDSSYVVSLVEEGDLGSRVEGLNARTDLYRVNIDTTIRLKDQEQNITKKFIMVFVKE